MYKEILFIKLMFGLGNLKFKDIKEIIIILISICGIVIAYQGLLTWKEQLKGTTRYKIAKDVLAKTFKIRDEFKNTRCVFTSSVEMSYVINKNKELNIEKASLSAYRKRLIRLSIIRRELEVVIIEADVVFGKEQVLDIKELVKKVNEMVGAFNSVYAYALSEKWKVDEDQIMRDRKILYGRFIDDDVFGKEIMDLVEKIDNRFRKFLK